MGLKNLFGKSEEKETIILFNQVMEEMVKIKALFSQCGDILLKGKFNLVEKKALEISDIEHKADDLRRKIGKRLYKGAFMPIMRSRLYDLSDGIDNIFDSIRDTANTFIYLKDKKMPAKVKNIYKKMVEEACLAIMVFEKVVRGFFAGAKDIEAKIKKANVHEHNLDVFKKEVFDEMLFGKKDAVTVWLVTDIASLISSVGDAIEDCCDKLAVLSMVRVA